MYVVLVQLCMHVDGGTGGTCPHELPGGEAAPSQKFLYRCSGYCPNVWIETSCMYVMMALVIMNLSHRDF